MSGYPIVVESEPTLEVWSATRYPRNSEKVCRIAYHPERAKYLDYLVAHECGHIYRFFSARPEDRLVPASGHQQLKNVAEEVKKESWELKNSIPKSQLKHFLQTLCSGLVRQLTNTPADCRIEFWIHENFESLRDVQAFALREIYATSAQCLAKEVERWTPPSIYNKSNAMNYVLAKWTGNLLNEPQLVTPYIQKGSAEMGERLARCLAKEDGGYLDDIRVADVWGRKLSIATWFQWRKFAEGGL